MSDQQIRENPSSEEPALELDVRQHVGSLRLQAAFKLTAPWTILFGPSGSGKSTLLRHIAGLAHPDTGFITLFGKPVYSPGIKVRPEKRPVRWAGQRAALFPHKTVRGNIVAGLSALRPEERTVELTDQALNLFGLHDLAQAYPAELSGGQRQYISIVRAAVGARHKLLLLDEPFAGLDAALRDSLLASLRQWLGRQTPILSVTHDVVEALQLGAEVIRLHEGRVVAQGPAHAVLAAEQLQVRAILDQPGCQS